MPITANDTNRKSWLEVPENSDFPIQNIPSFPNKRKYCNVEQELVTAIDLGALQQSIILKVLNLQMICSCRYFNDLHQMENMETGKKPNCKLLIQTIPQKNNIKDRDIVIFRMEDVKCNCLYW
jgi:fumarylacetoacetase